MGKGIFVKDSVLYIIGNIGALHASEMYCMLSIFEQILSHRYAGITGEWNGRVARIDVWQSTLRYSGVS